MSVYQDFNLKSNFLSRVLKILASKIDIVISIDTWKSVGLDHELPVNRCITTGITIKSRQEFT